MFFPNSRYDGQATYQVTMPNGAEAMAVRLPLPKERTILGFHRRHEGQRLDLLANYYLKDATAFFKLCEASGAMSPDALGARDLIAIPVKEK